MKLFGNMISIAVAYGAKLPNRQVRCWALPLLATALLSACTPESKPAGFDRELAVTDFREDVQALAADRMQGRSPSSAGEEATLRYLTEAYQKIGLQPAVNGGYLQPVPLVAITADRISPLLIAGESQSLELQYVDDMIVWTKQHTQSSRLQDSELVFVGYGIISPEHGWNDYEGLDVRGKTVLILVNDPGFATQDPAVFNGNAMTYYGRWTYKYEEAARQGAAGAIIVHETDAAGYPWEVVSAGWEGEQFDLVSDDKNASRVAVEGWVTQAAAERMFALSGENYETAKRAAARPGFQALPLAATASVSFENAIRTSDSRNVIGYLPGAERPEQYIVYTAHWDHLGTMPAQAEDRIYNGAKDNAAGVAMVLGIARGFARSPAPPARSVVFLLVTAEESGLLGSAWYAAHPVFPLETTVANINIDSPTLLGPTEDITVIGYGNSELEKWLAEVAAEQGRFLEREPTPEKGFFYRSDHFNFAKRGVPAVYAKGGVAHREKGRDYGLEWERDYIANRYHKVSDEYDPAWDLRGLGEDMDLLYRLGRNLANSSSWPNWVDGNEFRRARDASSAAR